MTDVHMGKRVRKSFSKINEVLDMPDLIEVQKNSYRRLIEQGLKEVLDDISPITDYNKTLALEFVGYRFDENPKYTIEECKERDADYATPLRVLVRLIRLQTGEFTESEIFIGDFPLMTPTGTFIINGTERVIVSQLVRSPGVYYARTVDKLGKELFSSTVIPNRGAWLEYETDSNDIMYVRIDRNRKLPVTVLLRAFGFGTDAQIVDLLGEDERILATIEKDTTKTMEEGLLEVYRRQRPGEPPTLDSARTLLESTFSDPKRYDLARVGRYKFNKKLTIAHRLAGQKPVEDVIDPATGEVLAAAGEVMNAETASRVQNAGVNVVDVDCDGTRVRIIGNGFVDTHAWLPDLDLSGEDMPEQVRFDIIKAIFDEFETTEDRERAFHERIGELAPKCIQLSDIIASISYNLNLFYGIGKVDDIDMLGNRRLRSVGELLQNQIRIGLLRLERGVRERMGIKDAETITPLELINPRPVHSAIKEFFGSSQLSQFMDQTNPLAELTHKRRMSALGPGGLNRERASFEVRDVHYSHYGRMCPIETPEGPNIGLIGSLPTYARINKYGFIETPYRVVDKEKGVVTDRVIYVTADEEEGYIVAQANEQLDEEGRFVHDRIPVRRKADITEVPAEQVDLMDVSPRQVVSVATAMIPFLENDDASRALMGSNMQRQAVPLLMPKAPIVGTGMEYKAARDSGVVVLCPEDGIVKSVSARYITILGDSGKEHTFKLLKFLRSNQSSCINQRPIVKRGERVTKGQVIADGPSTDQGEIALGRNVLIGFMTWEGYNYEDAVLISEKLVKEDAFTSIHIEKYESEARDTKLGPEEITCEIPNVGEDALRNLDANGIIRIGAEVHAGDILVGKVTPKGETELTAEERLLRAIFGEKAREVRDTSLRVPHGEEGIVVDVKIFTRENRDELASGVNTMVRVYIAQKRKIQVGDKMAGRHGNKGVVSRVLPEEDMPFLEDGTPLEIVLNPLGVPSRMNIGQVLEVHLGLAAAKNGWHIATPVFDGATQEDITQLLQEAGYPADGKMTLYDGRTGEPFENRVTVGYMYYLKLSHMVDDKIHARSTGPYSLVTQQPLGGKAQFGGQRFGEMEVWALEAYGAAHTLQEILTVKSDDVVGRVKTYESIVKGENISEPGIPESFKVLIKELQSLALDIKVFSDTHEEVNLSEDEDDVRPASEGGESEADDGFDTQSIMSAAPGSDEATESDDFGDFDLTSFPELDDLDISDGSGDAGTSLDDLDIDI